MDIKKKEKILKMLSFNEYINITDFAKKMNLPRTTVVYYINHLISDGLIEKARGNIKKISFLSEEAQSSKKLQINATEKKLIAQKAAQLIKPKDIIYIDAGSTTTFLIEFIKDKDIIVYTNNILFMEKIPNAHFKPKVFVVPGEVYKNTSSIVGILVMDFISRIYIDKAFIGANYVDRNLSVFTTNQEEATLKRSIIKQAKKSFILYDSNKVKTFNKESKYLFTKLSANVKGVKL